MLREESIQLRSSWAAARAPTPGSLYMGAVGFRSALRIVGRVAALAGAGLLSTAASAPAATTASLTVSVSPATVHRGGSYTITITGRYRARARHTHYRLPPARHHEIPYLLAFIQYSGTPCRNTATAEYSLPTRYWSWVFFPQRAEQRSPFKLVFHERTRTRFGKREVCAYLYATKITPQSTGKPIARASAGLSEARK